MIKSASLVFLILLLTSCAVATGPSASPSSMCYYQIEPKGFDTSADQRWGDLADTIVEVSSREMITLRSDVVFLKSACAFQSVDDIFARHSMPREDGRFSYDFSALSYAEWHKSTQPIVVYCAPMADNCPDHVRRLEQCSTVLATGITPSTGRCEAFGHVQKKPTETGINYTNDFFIADDGSVFLVVLDKAGRATAGEAHRVRIVGGYLLSGDILEILTVETIETVE